MEVVKTEQVTMQNKTYSFTAEELNNALGIALDERIVNIMPTPDGEVTVRTIKKMN